MGYRTLRSCLDDLRRTGRLIEIVDPVDPRLEMAAVQRRAYRQGAPALYFSNPIGCSFPMVSNLFGTEDRIEYIFRDGIEPLRKAIVLGADPLSAVSNRLNFRSGISLGWAALKSFYYSKPKRISAKRSPVLSCRTTLDRLPQLVGWPMDGGAYVTLPQVYTESTVQPDFGRSNLGMYRVQISGNDYVQNQEAGLHYQIHRGIAQHHAEALAAGKPLRVNVFVGGAPAMTLAAVMPLPEGVSELLFAGILGQHRIPMTGFDLPIYAEADFCLSGTLDTVTKKEGPFGDHLGYYSLEHDFPVFRIDQVWHRKDAVWPFTVVGRPPQEDTMFGKFIHHLVGDVVSQKIPGVQAVHAVDEAGVHPLLLAIGRENYLPLDKERRAAELHTLAHAIFGFGQLSLAKYLFLAAREDDPSLDVYDVAKFLQHILRRVDWRRDVHLTTRTTIDTLDYSGYSDGKLHHGSKMFVAVGGKPIRELADSIPSDKTDFAENPRVVFPGVVCVEKISYETPVEYFPDGFPLIVLVDDSAEASRNLRNFLWTTFTKSDPARDVHGIGEFIENKHWGCFGPLVIDARKKPYHAPELVEPPEIARRADAILEKYLR